MNHSGKSVRRYDYYGFLRLLMCVMTGVAHYYVLVGFPGGITVENLPSLGGNMLERFTYGFVSVATNYGGEFPICFFVLSGFLMHAGYHERIREGKIKFGSYIARRMVRLFPLLIFSIFVWSVGQWMYFYMHRGWWTGRPASLWHVAAALTGIGEGTFMNIHDTVNGPIWYISVLMICYVVYYLLSRIYNRFLAYGKKIGIAENAMSYVLFAIPVSVGFASYTYGLYLPFINVITAVGYIGFFIGVLTSILAYGGVSGKQAAVAGGALFFYAALFAIYGSTGYKEIMGPVNYFLGMIFFPAVIFVIEYLAKRFYGLFHNDFMDVFGKLSFPLYLLQMPVYLWGCFFWELHHEGEIPPIKFVYAMIAGCFGVSVLWCMIEGRIKLVFEKMISRMIWN